MMISQWNIDRPDGVGGAIQATEGGRRSSDGMLTRGKQANDDDAVPVMVRTAGNVHMVEPGVTARRPAASNQSATSTVPA
jgi:hypothetical protein